MSNYDWCSEGWKVVKLGDLGEVNRGRSLHRPRYAEHLYSGKYPFIQTGDIKSSNGKITHYKQTYSEAGLAQSRLWPADTMCIAITANIAETAILTFPSCFPDSVIGFIPDNSKCDVRFIEYMFRYLKKRIQHEATGSVQDNINLGTLGGLYFPLPLLPKQKAIANFLNTKTSSINNYLKSKSSELTNLADSKTHLYNSINNYYKTTRLKYVATVISGKSLSSKPVLNNPQPVNVVSFKHVLDDNIITSGLQSGNVSSEFLVKNKLKYNDVLITGEGDYHLLGRSGLFKDKANSYVAGCGVYVIRVNQELVDPDFLVIYIRTSICKNYFSTHNLSAHYPPRISLTDLKNLPVPLIPLPDQKQIAATVKSKISKINSCINLVQSQIKLMEEYRKSLIFEAVTGKLDI